ncbi:MAG: N-acetyltransferase family protein [Acidimicrobiales bacterium]
MPTSLDGVRRARVTDIDTLAAVHLRSALTAYASIFPPDAPPPTVEQLAARWREAHHDRSSEVFAAVIDGQVRGGVIASTESAPGVGSLRHLYVEPAWWGSGAGRSLHDAVVDWCVAAGVPTLDLWVLEQNHRARRMYERWGWALDVDAAFTNPGSAVTEVRYVLGSLGPR